MRCIGVEQDYKPEKVWKNNLLCYCKPRDKINVGSNDEGRNVYMNSK